jgi:hypothetical protein
MRYLIEDGDEVVLDYKDRGTNVIKRAGEQVIVIPARVVVMRNVGGVVRESTHAVEIRIVQNSDSLLILRRPEATDEIVLPNKVQEPK